MNDHQETLDREFEALRQQAEEADLEEGMPRCMHRRKQSFRTLFLPCLPESGD